MDRKREINVVWATEKASEGENLVWVTEEWVTAEDRRKKLGVFNSLTLSASELPPMFWEMCCHVGQGGPWSRRRKRFLFLSSTFFLFPLTLPAGHRSTNRVSQSKYFFTNRSREAGCWRAQGLSTTCNLLYMLLPNKALQLPSEAQSMNNASVETSETVQRGMTRGVGVRREVIGLGGKAASLQTSLMLPYP